MFLLANPFQKIRYLWPGNSESWRPEWWELEVRTRRLLGEGEQAGKIDRSIGLEHLPGPQRELQRQRVDDFCWSAGLDFQPYDVAPCAGAV